ncbi:MAG: DNA-binding protein WhiA [Clostridiales bacterium 43-6]|nr:MAG: DNA-binding protein WhiA [Clostridiales bacterium 43-6]
MSFSQNVKKELTTYWPKSRCCKIAEIYGLLLFCKRFDAHSILFHTDLEDVALRLMKLLSLLFSIHAEVLKKEGKTIVVTVPKEADRKALTGLFRKTGIDLSLLECGSCKQSFVRGAFFSCGTVIDPSKEYDLEFKISDEQLSWDFSLLLKEFSIDPKITERTGSTIIYIKESENIEDILTLMEAPNSSLEVMNVKILKTFRNKANRITNCETANIGKTVNAAAQQLAAITLLQETGHLENLSPELKAVANARLENEDAPLSELAQMVGVSRSGINHRLQKLITIAEEIKAE